MKQLLFICSTLFITAIQLSAQVKATTETGNTVILYKNGTWEYYEAGMELNKEASTTPAPAAIAPIATPAVISLDPSANTSSERHELFNEVSPKMAKYFGDEKGKVRCYVKCMNNNGQGLINFELFVPVGDGYRYFGNTIEGRQITLTLTNNQDVTLTFTQDTEGKFLDKYNQTYFIGSCAISDSDLQLLHTFNITKVFIDWKKNPETYRIEGNASLKESINQLL